KAAFVGANTVNGPLLFNVSTRPAAFTAATSVVWSAELTALSMMSFDLNIDAPPTIGLSCWLATVIDATASSTMTNILFTVIPSLLELICRTRGIYGIDLSRGFTRMNADQK